METFRALVALQPMANSEDGAPPVRLCATYVLPIFADVSQARALSGYLRRPSQTVDDVVVVDGSPSDVFAAQARAWSPHVRHLRPAFRTLSGKVGWVMTGVEAASWRE